MPNGRRNPDSVDLFFQGSAWLNKGVNRENMAQARGFFERALAFDSRNIDAQRLPETFLEFVRGGALDRQAHPHAAGEGEELIGSQAFEEPSVAGEYDGEQDVRVEPGGTQQAQLGENGRQHLLRLVDDQDRPRQRGVNVGLPALAQHLGAGPAVVGAQLDAEQVAHLA